MDSNGFLSILIRFLHLGSIAGLVGGVIYARFAANPALAALNEPQRVAVAQAAQAKFRSILFTLLTLVVLSGLYQGFGPGAPHHAKQWHMWFGIKMLVVLHFLTTSVLWATAPYSDAGSFAKQTRRLTGLVIAGLLAILLGNSLRYISIHYL